MAFLSSQILNPHLSFVRSITEKKKKPNQITRNKAILLRSTNSVPVLGRAGWLRRFLTQRSKQAQA